MISRQRSVKRPERQHGHVVGILPTSNPRQARTNNCPAASSRTVVGAKAKANSLLRSSKSGEAVIPCAPAGEESGKSGGAKVRRGGGDSLKLTASFKSGIEVRSISNYNYPRSSPGRLRDARKEMPAVTEANPKEFGLDPTRRFPLPMADAQTPC